MSTRILITFVAEFLAVALGIINFKSLDKKLRYLFVFVCFALFTEVTLLIITNLGVRDTRPGLHVYVPIEFLLFALMYLKSFGDYYNQKKIKILIVIFLIFSIINPLFLQELYEYSNTRIYSSLILIFFSILYFNRIVSEAKIERLQSEPMIWINTAVLLYFSGNFFFNLLFSIILEHSRELSKLTINVFSVLNILFYVLIAIGFWKAGKQKS